MRRLVLIDGHAILHRAFHAYPPLTNSKGELVGAVYGFSSILLTVLKKLHPEYAAVAFDKKAPTFRHKKYKDYKAHRKPMDEDLIKQILPVHEVVGALNIPIFEKSGYEADDVIGTLVSQAARSADEILIVTGDQDAMQLVDGNVKVYMPARGKQAEKIYDKEAVLKKYGLKPAQVVDFKALAGDSSDGIPGVAGIGPKTAVKLLNEYNTLESIYSSLDELPSGIVQKLRRDKKQALLSQELARIDTNSPVKLDLRACRLTDYDRGKVIKLFEELEFKSLIKKLPENEWMEMAEKTLDGKMSNTETLNLTDAESAEKNAKQMGLF